MKRQLVRTILWFVLVLVIGLVEVVRAIPVVVKRLGLLGSALFAMALVTWRVGLWSPALPLAAAIVGYLESTITLRQIGRVARYGARHDEWWRIESWV